mmetsp:Transcript_54852/g.87070  ORF Transcript_54852/g.87070 Transcript_54852/m.87070 type:complete len:222 (-) Transcript_54852:2159-2824(-)
MAHDVREETCDDGDDEFALVAVFLVEEAEGRIIPKSRTATPAFPPPYSALHALDSRPSGHQAESILLQVSPHRACSPCECKAEADDGLDATRANTFEATLEASDHLIDQGLAFFLVQFGTQSFKYIFTHLYTIASLAGQIGKELTTNVCDNRDNKRDRRAAYEDRDRDGEPERKLKNHQHLEHRKNEEADNETHKLDAVTKNIFTVIKRLVLHMDDEIRTS